MSVKKLFYKFTNAKKYKEYKNNLNNQKKINFLKSGFESQISNIHKKIRTKKDLSFLHSGHLGDIINALPVIKELAKTHKCKFYIQAKKPLPEKTLGYKNPKDYVFMSDKMVDMVLPLLKNQEYIHKVDIYNSEEIDIDLDLFRKIPMNFNLDEVRWYFQLTGIQTDLSKPYIAVEPSKKVQNKVVIMRSTRRKNIFINYKFLKKYKDLLFLGLQEEYEDLRKEVPHLEFYDCKDF